ncbi:hypothetical protein ACLMJK_004107 [Lecanora helva]
MEERASIRPGLPSMTPTESSWQIPPSPLSDYRTTASLPETTDVLIIGSGITGASLAYNILSKASPPSVVLLEARFACSGATGRNGGHTKHAAYREFLDNMRDLGEDEAARILRFKFNCMRNVHNFAKEQGIDCDSWQGDTVDVFYDRGQLEKAKKATNEIMRVLGRRDPAAKYEFWNAQDAKKKFLVEGSYGALSYEAGSLWPYKFVIGLLELGIKLGLNLQTWTPALKLMNDDAKGAWTVLTGRGVISAKKVVLATNGYTAHLIPALQGVIVPLRGHMTAQRPGSGLPKDGLRTTYSFIYDDGYEYMISRPKGTKFGGDIMIGGGSTKTSDKGIREFGTTDDAAIDSVILDYLSDSAASRFRSCWGKDSPDGRMRNAWTGIMGYSADGFPLVGQIPNQRGLYISASFQGSGMVLCFDSARALINIMDKEDEDELNEWFPKAFRMCSARTAHKFRGRLHTTVSPMELEVKSQL